MITNFFAYICGAKQQKNSDMKKFVELIVNGIYACAAVMFDERASRKACLWICFLAAAYFGGHVIVGLIAR